MSGKIGMAIVATLLLVIVVPSTVEAAVCKGSRVTALGKWQPTMFAARASARYAWKRKTRAIYGSRFDTWWRSANKSYGCWSYNKRERCRVKARPCRAGS